jgi:hypothetical protein
MLKSSRTNMVVPVSRTVVAGAIILGIAAGMGYSIPAHADNLMAEYYLPSTNVGDAHDLAGRAFFTYMTSSAQGNLQVELINDSTPDSVNDLISSVSFTIAAPDQMLLAATPRGPSAAAGQTADPYIWSFAGGTTGPTQIAGLSPLQSTTGSPGVTADLAAPWTINLTGHEYVLSSAAGATGPGDRLGPTAAASNYLYFSNIIGVSSSDPILAGPIFFDFTVPGLQSTDSISGVSFGYGTDGGTISGRLPTVPAPEPVAWALLASGMVAGWAIRRKTVCKS